MSVFIASYERVGFIYPNTGAYVLATKEYGLKPAFFMDDNPYSIYINSVEHPEMRYIGDPTKYYIQKNLPKCKTWVVGKRILEDSNVNHLVRLVTKARDVNMNNDGAVIPSPRYIIIETDEFIHRGELNVYLENLCNLLGEGTSFSPIPERQTIYRSGIIQGTKGTLCWRTFNFTQFGTPQKKRVTTFALDLDGENSIQILFNKGATRGSDLVTASSIRTSNTRIHEGENVVDIGTVQENVNQGYIGYIGSGIFYDKIHPKFLKLLSYPIIVTKGNVRMMNIQEYNMMFGLPKDLGLKSVADNKEEVERLIPILKPSINKYLNMKKTKPKKKSKSDDFVKKFILDPYSPKKVAETYKYSSCYPLALWVMQQVQTTISEHNTRAREWERRASERRAKIKRPRKLPIP